MKQILGIALLTLLFACNQTEKKPAEVKDSVTGKTVETDFLKDTLQNKIINQYFLVKDALVKSDSLLTQKSAADLQKTFEEIKMKQPLGYASAGKIANTTNLVLQRSEFVTLSVVINDLAKKAELTQGSKLYIQHCPMANKGDGADWLSSIKEVKNPYYGDEMLECGRVVEEIKQ